MIEDEPCLARCMGSFTQMENHLLALAREGNVNCLHEQSVYYLVKMCNLRNAYPLVCAYLQATIETCRSMLEL